MIRKKIAAKLSILMVLTYLSGCIPQKQKQILLSQPKVTYCDNISSSSGIATINKSIYVVGDDTPYLYELNSNLKIINKIQLSAIDSMINGRTPSSIKADFECMAEIDKNNLLILSSGSVAKSRDTAYLFDINNNNLIAKNLRAFYNSIKSAAMLPNKSEINIEALATTNDSIFFFHRGNLNHNFIATTSRDSFTKYYLNDGNLPEVFIHKFELPKFEGYSSGFSGACISPDSKGFIFTASLEATYDEVSDGEVKGSFIGYIPLITISSGIYSSSLLKDSKGNIMPKKLEGVSILNHNTENHEHFSIITVVDNDDGTSEFIRIKILLT